MVKSSKTSTKSDARVDAYIEKAAPFAIPILVKLRALVHKASPGIEETIKWGRPFFMHNGEILANMSGFKEHCSFGFWGTEIGEHLKTAGVLKDDAAGSLGKIASVKDLPSDAVMIDLIRKAVGSIDAGGSVSIMTAGRAGKKGEPRKVTKPEVEMPEEFAGPLAKNKRAAAVFEKFSPSAKLEYIEWIVDAKREETREKRIATALEWIAEGKHRHWKYGA